MRLMSKIVLFILCSTLTLTAAKTQGSVKNEHEALERLKGEYEEMRYRRDDALWSIPIDGLMSAAWILGTLNNWDKTAEAFEKSTLGKAAIISRSLCDLLLLYRAGKDVALSVKYHFKMRILKRKMQHLAHHMHCDQAKKLAAQPASPQSTNMNDDAESPIHNRQYPATTLDYERLRAVDREQRKRSAIERLYHYLVEH